MQVTKIRPQGFCKGVVRAIKIAEDTALQYPDTPIYILGMIVHNRFVVDSLDKLGIKTLNDKNKSRLELLDEIETGVVILTAHGTSDEVKIKAESKGLIVIDATCLDVEKTKLLIIDKLKNDFDIAYIGKQNHPEAEAMISIFPQRVHLISSYEDATNFNIQNDNIFITNQTTMSLLEVEDWIANIVERYPNAEIQQEICAATRMRQEAIMKLNDDFDAIFVVGDPNSNNTQKLADIAKNICFEKVFTVESVADIQDMNLSGLNNVAITSGASTPTYLTDDIILYLEMK